MLKMDGLKSKFAFPRASARPTKQAMCVYILSLNQLERSLAVPIFSPDPWRVLERNKKRGGKVGRKNVRKDFWGWKWGHEK